jgi:pimeloyl-ACP methyl ester carboxylesterase
MDTYADDLASLFEFLDLKDAIMVGHSTGGGEVAPYLGRHGTSRVAKAVLLGAVPPLLKTDKHPAGESALASAKLIRNATLKVYPGYPHGMVTTHPEVINPDLLAFFRS